MLLGMQVCIIKIIHYCLGCYFGDQHGGGGGGSEMFWEWSKRPNEVPK